MREQRGFPVPRQRIEVECESVRIAELVQERRRVADKRLPHRRRQPCPLSGAEGDRVDEPLRRGRVLPSLKQGPHRREPLPGGFREGFERWIVKEQGHPGRLMHDEVCRAEFEVVAYGDDDVTDQTGADAAWEGE